MFDAIFHMFEVKQELMNKLNVINPNTDRVIIFINLEMVMNILLNPRNNNKAKAFNDINKIKIELISHIVNLASHYKLYCEKRRIDSKIVLYWNYPYSDFMNNSKFIPEYRSNYLSKFKDNISCDYLSRCIDECYSFTRVLINYLDGIYLVNSNQIESGVIPLIFKNSKMFEEGACDTQYVLVSNFTYEYQYVNNGFTILEPGGDDSKIVNRNNVINVMKDRFNIKNQESISPNMIPFAISLMGDRYRNISKMQGVGLSHVIGVVNRAIEQLLITENTTNIEMLSSIITDSYREQFIKNYQSVDINEQFKVLNESELDVIYKQIEDKFDDNALYKINDKNFKSNPLRLVDSRRRRILSGGYERKSVFSNK